MMNAKEEALLDWDVDYFLITFEAANGDPMCFPPFQSSDEEAKSKFYAIKGSYKNIDIRKYKGFFHESNDPRRLELLDSMVQA